MKTRNGFVSNSSSSSFVIISQESDTECWKKYIAQGDLTLRIPHDLDDPITEFGWEYQCYYRFEDKLCWAFIQAQHIEGYIENSENCKNLYDAKNYPKHYMLFSVLKKKLRYKEIIVRGTIEDCERNQWSIDHQSLIDECERNAEIFESEENLEAFLFNDQSYISNGNDNQEYDRSKPPKRNKSSENTEINNELLLLLNTIIDITKSCPSKPNKWIIDNAKSNLIKCCKEAEIKLEANKMSTDELREFYIQTKMKEEHGTS